MARKDPSVFETAPFGRSGNAPVILVRPAGFEPARLTATGFEPAVSAVPPWAHNWFRNKDSNLGLRVQSPPSYQLDDSGIK